MKSKFVLKSYLSWSSAGNVLSGAPFFFHILDPVDGNFADKCLILKEKPTASAFEEICSPVRHHVFIAVKNSSFSGMVLWKIILCEMVF